MNEEMGLPQPFEGKEFDEIVEKVVENQLSLSKTLKEQLATMASQYFADLSKESKKDMFNSFEVVDRLASLDGFRNQTVKLAFLSLLNPAFSEPYQKLIGISSNQFGQMYNEAYVLYQSNHFEQACNQFAVLCILSPKDVKYLFGLAACCQKLNLFNLAKIAYSKAEEVNPSDPTPAWHRHECEKRLGELKSAKASLNHVILLGLSNSEYFSLVKDAIERLEEIEEE